MLIQPPQLAPADKRFLDKCYLLAREGKERFDYTNAATIAFNHPKDGLIPLISESKRFRIGETKKGLLKICHAEGLF